MLNFWIFRRQHWKCIAVMSISNIHRRKCKRIHICGVHAIGLEILTDKTCKCQQKYHHFARKKSLWKIPSYLPASLCASDKNIMFWKRPYNVAYELSKVHYLSAPVRVCVRSRWPGVRLQTRVVYSLTAPKGILTPYYYFSPPRRAFAYILVYDAYLFYVAHLLTSKFTTTSDRKKWKGK